MTKLVYLDSAATTFTAAEVLTEMMPCFNTIYGNPSSVHSFGREAAAMVDKARDRIQKAINAERANEIYFTSGGTEANNWAIKGLAYANQERGKHIIVSKIEHESILASCKELEEEGFEVTYLNVDNTGLVSLAELIHYLRKDTILVSIMTANNEVGTIQTIKAIAKTVHESGAIFHTDAVQALGSFKIDVVDLEIDAMSLSSHKIYGPKGVGCLYLKNGVMIKNLISGGNQERDKRAGTLNLPAIVGFGKATEIAIRDMSVNQSKIKTIRDYFIKQIQEKIPYVHFNGHPYQKVQGILSVSFEMVEKESISLMLDQEGIAVSTGSACTAGSVGISHVLKAMRIPEDLAQGTIRFSFSKSLSKDDIDYAVEKLVNVIERLRSISAITKAGRGEK